jgi:hypothetical protein
MNKHEQRNNCIIASNIYISRKMILKNLKFCKLIIWYIKNLYLKFFIIWIVLCWIVLIWIWLLDTESQAGRWLPVPHCTPQQSIFLHPPTSKVCRLEGRRTYVGRCSLVNRLVFMISIIPSCCSWHPDHPIYDPIYWTRIPRVPPLVNFSPALYPYDANFLVIFAMTVQASVSLSRRTFK